MAYSGSRNKIGAWKSSGGKSINGYNKWLKGIYILCDYALFVGYIKPQKKKTRGSEISTTNSRNGAAMVKTTTTNCRSRRKSILAK